MRLRSYQEEQYRQAGRSFAKGNRRIILQAATGTGKTIVAAAITKGAIEKGNKVLYLVDKRDLVYQARDRFISFGLDGEIGLIMSGEEPDHHKPIQICTIQTYNLRIKSKDPKYNVWFHSADVVIVDECHHGVCRTYIDVLDHYKEKSVVIGLTATPTRSDGRGLGRIFDDIVCCEGIKPLTEKGHLVPMQYKVPAVPDLEKIKIVAGDYNKKELGAKMDKPKLIADVFSQWARFAPTRQTIVFAVNVKHSKHMRDKFMSNGVSCEHVDAHTKPEDRELIYDRFRSGETRVLTNVGIATEGSDFPCCSCVVIARPTKSFALYIQMAGRGLRPDEGKDDCVLIDHAGVWHEHGYIDDPVMWTLSDTEKAWKKAEKKEKQKKELICEGCTTPFHGKRCPLCGTLVKDYGKKIAAIEEAELIEATKGKKTYSAREKRKWYAMFLWYARMKGFKSGWAYHKTKEKFGSFVRGARDIAPIEPDEEVSKYIKYLNIKHAKRKNTEVASGCSAGSEWPMDRDNGQSGDRDRDRRSQSLPDMRPRQEQPPLPLR